MAAAEPGPTLVLQLAGLAALVVLAGIDAFAPGWDPDPWSSYVGGIVTILWGPRIVAAFGRK